ncbi:MAG: VacJ family lipoprotein [Sphingomonadales bacterium]|nr:VacJ family lipoprotein [Sphingomonadales bacterium]
MLIAAALAIPGLASAQAVTSPPVAMNGITNPGAARARPVRARHATAGDPVEGVNRGLFSVHQFLDRLFFRPVAMAYKTLVPKFVRTGVRHVISNLSEPVVFLNDVLQLKPKRAVRTFGRFAINTTLGVGGIIDVAKGEKLPHRSNGFGNTLGRYGVGPGPYLFIPLVGPTDLRDLIGGQADGAVLPLAVGDPFNRTAYIIPTLALAGLDQRAESDADLKALLSGAADPYATLRSVYLQSRAAEVGEIRHGRANGALDDPLVDPEAAPGHVPAPTDVFDTTPADREPNAAAAP